MNNRQAKKYLTPKKVSEARRIQSLSLLALLVILDGCNKVSNYDRINAGICEIKPTIFSENMGLFFYERNDTDFSYVSFDRKFGAIFKNENGKISPISFDCKRTQCDSDFISASKDFKVISEMPKEWGIGQILKHQTDSALTISTHYNFSYFIGKDIERFLIKREVETLEVTKTCIVQFPPPEK